MPIEIGAGIGGGPPKVVSFGDAVKHLKTQKSTRAAPPLPRPQSPPGPLMSPDLRPDQRSLPARYPILDFVGQKFTEDLNEASLQSLRHVPLVEDPALEGGAYVNPRRDSVFAPTAMIDRM